MSSRPQRLIKEIPVRNNPGIAKRYAWDAGKQQFVDTGKYRATRRERVNGRSKKVQAVFDNFEDAKAFRAGLLQKTSTGTCWHRTARPARADGMTFSALVERWRAFTYLKLEKSTQQTYDKLSPSLDLLADAPVEAINVQTVDELIKHWVQTQTSARRKTFGKELDLLRTILHFHRKRHNAAYIVPILPEHYEAADVAKAVQPEVATLSTVDLGRFLGELQNERNHQYHVLALAQFCLGLRIGEACGLCWQGIDLEARTVTIQQTITWDQYTWEPNIKPRPKNRRARQLVIPDVLLAELQKLHDARTPGVDLVFHTAGMPLNRKTVGVVYNRVLKRLGITHVTGTHMLRKTSATLANEATGDLAAVQHLLDHASPTVTMRYVASTMAQKQKMASALDQMAAVALTLPPLMEVVQATSPGNESSKSS